MGNRQRIFSTAVLGFLFLLRALSAPASAGDGGARILGMAAIKEPYKPVKSLQTRTYNPDGTHVEFSITFSKEMSAALRDWNPDFKLWTQSEYDSRRIKAYEFSLHSTPSAVIGYFNGDVWPDVYLTGHDKTHFLNIAVLSGSSTTYHILVQNTSRLEDIPSWSYTADTKKFRNVLIFQAKGNSYDYGGDMAEYREIRTLEHDGIAIGDIWRDKSTGEEKIELLKIISWNERENKFTDWDLLTDPDSPQPSGPLSTR